MWTGWRMRRTVMTTVSARSVADDQQADHCR